MFNHGETNNSHVGGNSCSYATISKYNNGSPGMSPPFPKSNVSGSYIVPVYGAPGYDVLTFSGGSCSGHPGIDQAYGPDSHKCNTTYTRMNCNGGHGHGHGSGGGHGSGSGRRHGS